MPDRICLEEESLKSQQKMPGTAPPPPRLCSADCSVEPLGTMGADAACGLHSTVLTLCFPDET